MIEAIVFDLDGVLVQTEKLKAIAYSKAVQKIRNLPKPEKRAIEAYREVVGAPREISATHVMNKLRLKKELIPLMSKYNVSTPIEALTKVRYEIYNEMIKDPQVILDNRWPHAIDILKVAKKNACKIGLATLSRRKNIEYIIKTLGVKGSLDVIVTADDVSRGKPDPEIYLLATKKLKVKPKNSLAIEDSVNGVKSALAAGLHMIAIATPFTKNNLLSSKVIDPKWIVLDPNNIEEAVRNRITEINKQT